MLMSDIHDTQYLWPVSIIHITYASILSIWYTIFLSHIHDNQYLCFVSMIHNAYIWYQWYKIFTFGIHDAQP